MHQQINANDYNLLRSPTSMMEVGLRRRLIAMVRKTLLMNSKELSTRESPVDCSTVDIQKLGGDSRSRLGFIEYNKVDERNQ